MDTGQLNLISIIIIASFINLYNSLFYNLVDLRKFNNTQIASAAVCPKCLQLNPNNTIGWAECQTLPSQFYKMIPTEEDFEVFYNIRSNNPLEQNKYAFPFVLDLNKNKEQTLEVFPISDDGGHAIQITNTNNCLFHDYTRTNISSVSYSTMIKPCNYNSRYFKFYFFKQLYTFPEFKIIGNALEYKIYQRDTPIEKTLGSLIRSGTLIKFTNRNNPSWARSVQFDPSSKKFKVQLPLGLWNVDVTVSDSNIYYYKKTPTPYFFTITKCHENMEYNLDIPVRKLLTEGSGGSDDKRMIFKIIAKRDVYIKQIHAQRWVNHCDINGGTYTGSTNMRNIRMPKNGCIIGVGWPEYSDQSDQDDMPDVKSYMNNISQDTNSFKISNGCKVNESYRLHERLVAASLFSFKEFHDCGSGLRVKIEFWDDSDIWSLS